LPQNRSNMPFDNPASLTERLSEEASQLLGCLAVVLAARQLVRAGAALGGSPPMIRVLEDCIYAASLAVASAALIAGCIALLNSSRIRASLGSRKRIYLRGALASTAWAVVNVTIFERARARATMESLVLLGIYCAIALMRRAAGAAGKSSRTSHLKWSAAACLVLMILPARLIERPIADWRIRQLRQQMGDVAAVERLKHWIINATENSVPVDGAELTRTGMALLSANGDAAPVSSAWEAALDIVNYRWSLEPAERNDQPASGEYGTVPTWGTLQFDVVPLGIGRGEGRARLLSPGTKAEPAAGEGAAALKVTRGRGPGAVVLDGSHFKNVTFDRVPVAYNGGSLELDNVSFPHCRVYTVNVPAGRRFIEAALGSRELHLRQ
jgi:hypothetical protein